AIHSNRRKLCRTRPAKSSLLETTAPWPRLEGLNVALRASAQHESCRLAVNVKTSHRVFSALRRSNTDPVPQPQPSELPPRYLHDGPGSNENSQRRFGTQTSAVSAAQTSICR